MLYLVAQMPVWAGAADLLTITSPSNKSVVQPGALVPVAVQVSGPVTAGVALDASFLGSPQLVANQPYTLNLTVPLDTPPGTYEIRAAAMTNGRLVEAKPVSIIVNKPVSHILRLQPKEIVFRSVGEQSVIQVIAVGADGSIFSLAGMPGLSVLSQAPGVAAVDSQAKVTAVSPGQTNLVCTYGTESILIPVTVITAIRGDLDGDGDVDIDDIRILMDELKSPATTANDARDLNKDGRVDALDSRIMTTLCTRAQCVVQ
jgi:hypothetical protein